MQRNTVHVGDSRELATRLAPQSVSMIVTSPPYWGLRRYLDDDHAHAEREMGSEDSPEEYVANLTGLFAALRPALHDTASVWINLGDAYANDSKWGGATGGKHAGGLHGASGIGRAKRATGYPAKCLMGLPWRVAFALIDDGWILRSAITWAKRAPMPESVTDRPTSATELVFLFAKQPRYYFDAAAIAEEANAEHASRYKYAFSGNKGDLGREWHGSPAGEQKFNGTRNARNFWLLGPEPFPDAHFATFPSEIPRRAIRAGSSERGVCRACGAPWRRVVERTPMVIARSGRGEALGEHGRTATSGTMLEPPTSTTVGWEASCACDAGVRPALVLDPFLGSGTTAAVAVEEGRDWIGFDLDSRSVGWTARRLARLPVRSLFAATPAD